MRILVENLKAIDNQVESPRRGSDRPPLLSMLGHLGDSYEATCAFHLPIAVGGRVAGLSANKNTDGSTNGGRRLRTDAVFVSYRREDTGHAAARIADGLKARFSQVFMDVNVIGPGADFTEAIAGALDQCEVFVAVIGPHWSTAEDRFGRRRLNDPEDWVFKEVVAALERRVPIFPVLIDRADPPQADELPPELQRLVRLQCTVLGQQKFNTDLAEFIAAMEVRLDATAVERILTDGPA
jgi:hypothetical protein